MITIIKEEIIDGYKVITYSNGAVVKHIADAVVSDSVPPEPSLQDIINANNTTMLLKISKALGV